MSRAIRFLLLVVALLPFTSAAVEVENLYVARVDAGLALNEGLMQSFEQVVVRASGQRNALVNPLISQQRKRLKDYVGQYGYIEADGKRWLEVTFNQEAMERLLRQANLPVWGSLRPLTLVWLVQEENFKRELVTDSAFILEQAQVSQIMQERGVPMLLPLLDLDDITAVDQADVWGLFLEPVLQASARYEADQVVLAKLYQLDGEEYQLSWHFYPLSSEPDKTPNAWTQGEIKGKLPKVVAEWWHQMSDALGERFATRASNAQADHVAIAIYNLTDLSRVLAAEKSLANMAMVSQVELQQVDGNQSIFKVHLLAPAEDFFQALKLDQQLEPMALNSEPEPQAMESVQQELAEKEPVEPLPSYMWRQ